MAYRKRILIAILALMTLLIASVSGTLALLSDRRNVVNTFTMGQVKVEISETTPNTATLSPGDVVAKDPQVKNAGTVPCFVRVIVSIEDAALPADQSVEDYITFGALGTGWNVKSGDPGWNSQNATYIVYYDHKLAVDESTTKVFENFTLNAMNGSVALLEGADDMFKINVAVEAVQSKNGDTDYASAVAAFSDLPAAEQVP